MVDVSDVGQLEVGPVGGQLPFALLGVGEGYVLVACGVEEVHGDVRTPVAGGVHRVQLAS